MKKVFPKKYENGRTATEVLITSDFKVRIGYRERDYYSTNVLPKLFFSRTVLHELRPIIEVGQGRENMITFWAVLTGTVYVP
jgi:hypothetical protein